MPFALNFPTTQEITHIVRNVIVDPTKFIGNEFAPVVGVYSEKVEVDVIEAVQGMTSAHSLNADPSIVTLPGQSTRTYATAYWKETYRMNEEELLFARREGTYNQRAGRDRVIRRAMEMNTRLETRIEWLRWQMLVNGKIQVNENNVKFTVPANIPNTNMPSFDWTDPSHNIIGDIENMLELFLGTGAKPKKAYFNYGAAKLMAQNEGIRDLLKQSIFATTLSPRNITKALPLLFPELEFELYAEGYGDGKGNFVPFIPSNKFIIRGEGMPGEVPMDFASTITLHNGGLDQPQPGKFSFIEDESQRKNPHVDITVGIYGLPRIFHPNWFVSATIAPTTNI
ncbi:hypothetical protein DNHGIG_15050 [Collibacillus ludicampi]|uniref:Major capsid protein n=1 Tax=Collibacillus ludicampi TaxID=2771369 RepID=A0AAV4LDZ6_9BACL|nr:major capsid protein [Collibacillus ludicampi]GIM45956.1 hypothetical protein DNHGIG_15050 [Collibacillus ludicampi]